MKKIVLFTTSLIVILVILYFVSNYSFKEGFDIVKPQCNKKGCPVTSLQSSTYKLHTEYKQIRDKNHMLAHNSQAKNFLFSNNGPANIFIIRHGEKIKSKHALDCNGILRSTYVPKLIERLNDNGHGVHAIVSAYDYHSMHQEQTVSLASWLMDIPLYLYGEQSQTDIAVQNIFTNKFFNGKTVLICWEHECIQSLIRSIVTIGAKLKGLNNYQFENPEGNSNLPNWNTDNYQSIMHFDENLKYSVSEERLFTCFPEDNSIITYSGIQRCK